MLRNVSVHQGASKITRAGCFTSVFSETPRLRRFEDKNVS
jgi:hypothetical protein